MQYCSAVKYYLAPVLSPPPEKSEEAIWSFTINDYIPENVLVIHYYDFQNKKFDQ